MPFDQSSVLDESAVPHLLTEILRTELGRIVSSSQDPLYDAETRLSELASERSALIEDAQRKTFAACEHSILVACDRLDFPRPEIVPFSLGRGVTVLLKSLNDLERQVLENFEDPLILAEPLLSRHELTVVDGKIPDMLRISDALEAALPGKSLEMARKLRATASIVSEFLGDIPLDLLPDHIESLLCQISRLPKHHGKRHGKNRYSAVGKRVEKR